MVACVCLGECKVGEEASDVVFFLVSRVLALGSTFRLRSQDRLGCWGGGGGLGYCARFRLDLHVMARMLSPSVRLPFFIKA